MIHNIYMLITAIKVDILNIDHITFAQFFSFISMSFIHNSRHQIQLETAAMKHVSGNLKYCRQYPY